VAPHDPIASLPFSEAGHRQLFEANLAGTYRCELGGKLLDCNQACIDLMGCSSKEEFLARSATEWYVHATDRDQVMATLAAQGRLLNQELQLRRADGTPIWIVANLALVRDVGGQPLYYEGTFVDITHRRQANEALAHERQLLALLMESFPESIFFKDRECRFVRINQACARKLGMRSASEAIGKTDFDFFAEPHARAAWDDEQEILRTGRPMLDKEESELFPDGHTAWGLTSKLPIFDTRGSVIGTFGISRDITSRKQLEDRLRHTQKMEAVGRLAGGVAHDFNNLLTVITGRCELLSDALPAGDPLRKHADEIQRSAQRAAGLTRQLLTFSRQQVVRLRPVQINACVENMVALIRRLIGTKVELALTLAPDLPNIQADPGQVEQILLNLAVNATDAMPDGGRLLIETEAVEREGGFGPHGFRIRPGRYTRLRVQDTGTGMDAATQARLFEPFFTTKAVGAGTGLGLATVYGIVKSYAGHVLVESAPGQGTTVSVYFPSSVGSEAPVKGADDLAGLSVAVVQPDPELRQLTHDMLALLGVYVFEAEPRAGVLCFPAPDPGTLDALMVDSTGWSNEDDWALQSIKQRWPKLKLLFLSATAAPRTAPPGYPAHHVLVLPKPFSSQDLRKALANLLLQMP